MWIPQRKKETPHTVVNLPAVVGIAGLLVPDARLSRHRYESSDDVLACVQNEGQSGRVGVAAAMELPSGETVATAAPQQRMGWCRTSQQNKSSGATDHVIRCN